jgi:hypothetical protein
MLTLGSELRAVFLVGGEGGICFSVRANKRLETREILDVTDPPI